MLSFDLADGFIGVGSVSAWGGRHLACFITSIAQCSLLTLILLQEALVDLHVARHCSINADDTFAFQQTILTLREIRYTFAKSIKLAIHMLVFTRSHNVLHRIFIMCHYIVRQLHQLVLVLLGWVRTVA